MVSYTTLKIMVTKMEETTKVQPDYSNEINWINGRIDGLYEELRTDRKRVRMLVALLIDKKIIGEELAKQIQETFKSEDKTEILNWFKNSIKKE